MTESKIFSISDILTFNTVDYKDLKRSDISNIVDNEYFLTKKESCNHLLVLSDSYATVFDLDTVIDTYGCELDFQNMFCFNVESSHFDPHLFKPCKEAKEKKLHKVQFNGTALLGYYNGSSFYVKDCLFIMGINEMKFDLNTRLNDIELTIGKYGKGLYMKSYYSCNYILQIPIGLYEIVPNNPTKQKYIYNLVDTKPITFNTAKFPMKEFTDLSLNTNKNKINCPKDDLSFEENYQDQAGFNKVEEFSVRKKIDMPEIYNLYKDGRHQGPARITTLEMSRWMDSLFKDNPMDTLQMKCGYDDISETWIPISVN